MTCAAPEVGFDELLLDGLEDSSLFLSIFDADDSCDSQDRSTSDEERSVSSSFSSGSAAAHLPLETLIPVPPQPSCVPLHMYPVVAQAVQFSPAPVMMNLCSSVAMTGKRALNSSGSSASTDDEEEFAKRQRKELRLMKNREAANRSRLKKKTAMEALEQQVEQLNHQVSELQQELAASRAECAALREQNDFLKSLVRTPGSDAASESSSWQASPRARASASASTGSGLSSGVMVLAIVCAFTFVSDWFAFPVPGSASASNSSSGYTAGGASIRGGRVLLSVDEDMAYGGEHSGIAMWDVQHMNWLARLLMYAGALCIILVVRQAVFGNTKHLLPF